MKNSITYQYCPQLEVKSITIKPSQVLYQNVILELGNSRSDLIPQKEFLCTLDHKREFHFGVNVHGFTSFEIVKSNATDKLGTGEYWRSDYIEASRITGIEQVDIIVIPEEGWRTSAHIQLSSLKKILKKAGLEITYMRDISTGNGMTTSFWTPDILAMADDNRKIEFFDEKVGLIDTFGVKVSLDESRKAQLV